MHVLQAYGNDFCQLGILGGKILGFFLCESVLNIRKKKLHKRFRRFCFSENYTNVSENQNLLNFFKYLLTIYVIRPLITEKK